MSLELPDDVAFMDGDSALPRDNGELTFNAPWEARAVAMAVALVDRLDLRWDEFRTRLITAIAEDPARPYYESWAVALERLAVELQVTTTAAVDRAEPSERPVL